MACKTTLNNKHYYEKNIDSNDKVLGFWLMVSQKTSDPVVMQCTPDNQKLIPVLMAFQSTGLLS
jgi:hypothetical protein